MRRGYEKVRMAAAVLAMSLSLSACGMDSLVDALGTSGKSQETAGETQEATVESQGAAAESQEASGETQEEPEESQGATADSQEVPISKARYRETKSRYFHYMEGILFSGKEKE